MLILLLLLKVVYPNNIFTPSVLQLNFLNTLNLFCHYLPGDQNNNKI